MTTCPKPQFGMFHKGPRVPLESRKSWCVPRLSRPDPHGSGQSRVFYETPYGPRESDLRHISGGFGTQCRYFREVAAVARSGARA